MPSTDSSSEQAKLHAFLNNRKAWSRVVEELQLSKRQTEIVRLILSGKQYRQISAALGIQVPTIQTQLDRIYRRNNLDDRIDLILKVFSIAWDIKCSGRQ